ncbi:MAG: hypothetical protein WKG07_38435 [Hymenobacter sp.]
MAGVGGDAAARPTGPGHRPQPPHPQTEATAIATVRGRRSGRAGRAGRYGRGCLRNRRWGGRRLFAGCPLFGRTNGAPDERTAGNSRQPAASAAYHFWRSLLDLPFTTLRRLRQGSHAAHYQRPVIRLVAYRKP